MKTKLSLAFVLLLVAGGISWHFWRKDAPRRESLAALMEFQHTLVSSPQKIAIMVVMPRAIRDRTSSEQTEFITKTLRDEISPEGIAALRHDARFGSLQEIFPEEAKRWAEQAQVGVDECVAFRREQDGLRTEVVLVREGQSFKILRCNNVKGQTSSHPKTP